MKGIVTTAIATLALLFCTQAVAKDKLIVWEDTGKAHGIEKAIKAFETQYNCDVEIHQSEYSGIFSATRTRYQVSGKKDHRYRSAYHQNQ